MLSIIASLAGALWGSQAGRILIIGGALFAFGLVKGWDWGRAGHTDALIARDLQWQLKIEQANRNAENETNARVRAALEAVAAVAPAPAGRDNLVKLCQSDQNCRNRHQQGQ